MDYKSNIETDVAVKYTVELNEAEMRGLQEMFKWSDDVVKKAFITVTYEPETTRIVKSIGLLRRRLSRDINTALQRIDNARKVLQAGGVE